MAGRWADEMATALPVRQLPLASLFVLSVLSLFRTKPSSSLWIRPLALSGDVHGRSHHSVNLVFHSSVISLLVLARTWVNSEWLRADGIPVVFSICKSKAHSEAERGWGWKVGSLDSSKWIISVEEKGFFASLPP